MMFEDPHCTCSTTDKLRAAFEGKPEPLCEMHDVDAVDARKRDDARREADAHAALLTNVVDEIRAEDELTRRRKAHAAAVATAEAELAAIADPLERSLTRLSQRSTDLPLGLPTSSYPALSGFTDHDGPDAA